LVAAAEGFFLLPPALAPPSPASSMARWALRDRDGELGFGVWGGGENWEVRGGSNGGVCTAHELHKVDPAGP
jgi:hypothetical protein